MEITRLEWEFIDWFEFMVVVSCFLALTHKHLHTLWYAGDAPIAPESVFTVAAKAFGWAALLSAYLMFRVDMLIIAGLIGWPIVFLAVTVATLAFGLISSAIAYSGFCGKCADQVSAFTRRRLVALEAVLTASVSASVSTIMTCFGACREYADRWYPLTRKRLGVLRDRIRMLFMLFAQK